MPKGVYDRSKMKKKKDTKVEKKAPAKKKAGRKSKKD